MRPAALLQFVSIPLDPAKDRRMINVQTPLWEHFDLSSSTMQAKSKQIRDLLGMYPMDPDWSIPSMIDQNPLVWMLGVNGFIIDVRQAPREVQEEAFRKGLIPYCMIHSLSKASRHTSCGIGGELIF